MCVHVVLCTGAFSACTRVVPKYCAMVFWVDVLHMPVKWQYSRFVSEHNMCDSTMFKYELANSENSLIKDSWNHNFAAVIVLWRLLVLDWRKNFILEVAQRQWRSRRCVDRRHQLGHRLRRGRPLIGESTNMNAKCSGRSERPINTAIYCCVTVRQ